MHYVYVTKDTKRNTVYIGYSTNVQQRLKQHQANNQDIKLIYYEAYKCEPEARNREKRLKMYGSAWRALKQRLQTSLKPA